MKKLISLAVLLMFAACGAWAEEGMWLLNAFPKDKIKAQYGFEPTQKWLDHVRLSSVRFNNGGSGSFVSADGLTFTNHHVGSECIHQLSSGEKDYIKNGFYAPTREEEAQCPDLELNVLQEIEDVTARVEGAAKPGASAAEAAAAQRGAMAEIEKECATKSGLRCDVVTFYSGGLYHLYKYKKYTDVRLVFAPEVDIAFFGGDPDNFNFPRYDLDIAFFRIYEEGKPVRLKHYLDWAEQGAKEGDLVFVSGHPGSTGRLLTMAQMEFLRDFSYPFNLSSFEARLRVLRRFSRESEENARVAQDEIFGLENSLKAVSGYLAGLKDKELMAARAAEQERLRKAVIGDPKWKHGDPWKAIEKTVALQREVYFPYVFLEQKAGFRGTMAGYARDLVRLAAEKQKANPERLREYRESALPSLEQRLFSTAPIHKDLEELLLAHSLGEMQERLGADHPAVRTALRGQDPGQVGVDLVLGTKLDDVNVRKQLYEGGAEAISKSTDPLIVLMREIDPEARALRKRYDDEVEATLRQNGSLIAKARFEKEGLSVPPDATFTLRLSYGAVKGYVENEQKVPFYTTVGGAFEHEAKHGAKPPYQLPKSWHQSKAKMKLDTPFNFVSTPDIIGGNSGSPTVNTKGEVVGIIFDGNIHSLAWRFAYSDEVARAISVDSRGIVEALGSVYGAQELLRELQSGKAAD